METFGQPTEKPILPQMDCWVITNHRNNNETKQRLNVILISKFFLNNTDYKLNHWDVPSTCCYLPKTMHELRLWIHKSDTFSQDKVKLIPGRRRGRKNVLEGLTGLPNLVSMHRIHTRARLTAWAFWWRHINGGVLLQRFKGAWAPSMARNVVETHDTTVCPVITAARWCLTDPRAY